MTVRRLAWAGFGLWAALSAAAIGLQITVDSTFNAAIAAVLAVLAAVGLLLSLRRPENPIGPILLAMAILITFSTATEGFYRQWDSDPTPPLGVRLLVASDETFGLVWLTAVGVALPLLFPTGRPPSPRWWPLLWGTLAVLVLSMLGTALGPERLDWGRTAGSTTRSAWAGRRAVSCGSSKARASSRSSPRCSARSSASVSACAALRDRAPAAEVDRASHWRRSSPGCSPPPGATWPDRRRSGNVGWSLSWLR